MTVQSAQQVHSQPQAQASTSGATYREPTFLDDHCPRCFPRGMQAQHNLLELPSSHPCNRHNLHLLEIQVALWTVLVGLMSHSGLLVLEEAVVARMEGAYLLLHSLPFMLAPKVSNDRVRLSPYR